MSANPVGDVHERIRRMLTEDQPTPISPAVRPQSPRPNPFRAQKPAGPLSEAFGSIKGALGQMAAPQTAPRRPRADAFGDTPEDLEIPAFLRRS